MCRLHDWVKPLLVCMLAKFQVTIVKNSSNAELNILFLYMPSEVFPASVIKTFLACMTWYSVNLSSCAIFLSH